MAPVQEDGTKINYLEKAQNFVLRELKQPKHDYDRKKLEDMIRNYKSDIPEMLEYC